MTESVIVSIDTAGEPVPVGTAFFTHRRGRLATTFRYHDEYLLHDNAFAIDPSAPLMSGTHHFDGLPRSFQDASPDRWGKSLIAKWRALQALREQRTPPSISDVDYLLDSDITRQGALRFQTSADGPFLAPVHDVPKLIELPKLLNAADTVSRDRNNLAAVKTLLSAGSGSLGGARPKASVRDGDRLLIAKFPHHHDDWNIMAWEKTALDLAELAGIDVPPRELIDVGSRSVLVLERFDRSQGSRLAYISAMTLVEGDDGGVADYIDIGEVLPEQVTDVQRDLRELWRRIAFSIAVHNTDDHLRNHGFLHDGAGWRLAPLFDVNPNPDLAAGRVTGVGGAHHYTDEVSGLRSYAAVFGLQTAASAQIIREVIGAVDQWRRVASRNGIPTAEQERFAAVFAATRQALTE